MSELTNFIDLRKRKAGTGRIVAFMGPAIMVSTGYIDPGNWATDLDGGARFGYQLLWVLVLSNLIALFLQTLAARLGIVSGKDLAQACRAYYPTPVAVSLWVLCEIAIIACDLAEVLGSAIALNLLFRIPLVWGAAITGFDVLLLISLQWFGVRRLEAVVGVLLVTTGVCLALQWHLAGPSWSGIASGFVPKLDSSNLYIAIAILGATVMPHNLYLHSSLVRTRQIENSTPAKREAIRMNFLDTTFALNIAFVLNASILILAAASFFSRHIAVTELRQAHELLSPLLGTSAASLAFALGLLAAAQGSTITGTLAGQIVMDGFLRIRLSPVLRRLVTRCLAIIPAVSVLAYTGNSGVMSLLVLSQVVLSLQLPFAMIPLLRFTNCNQVMGVFANAGWIKLLGGASIALITSLNMWLAMTTLREVSSDLAPIALAVVCALLLGLMLLLCWITCTRLRADAGCGAPFH
jgi:manganese transport protein